MAQRSPVLLNIGCWAVILLLAGVLISMWGYALIVRNGRVSNPTQVARSSQATPTAGQPLAGNPLLIPTGNRGIVFGELSILATNANTSQAGVLVRNTSDQVKTFTVKATFLAANQVVARATGTVNDLQPGQSRGVLLVAQPAIPPKSNAVRIEIDAMLQEAASTHGAEAATKLSFGRYKINTTPTPSIEIEVKNNDSLAHSFTVQAAFLKGEKLIAFGTGTVADLMPGQTKTANIPIIGPVEATEIRIAIDTVSQ